MASCWLHAPYLQMPAGCRRVKGTTVCQRVCRSIAGRGMSHHCQLVTGCGWRSFPITLPDCRRPMPADHERRPQKRAAPGPMISDMSPSAVPCRDIFGGGIDARHRMHHSAVPGRRKTSPHTGHIKGLHGLTSLADIRRCHLMMSSSQRPDLLVGPAGTTWPVPIP